MPGLTSLSLLARKVRRDSSELTGPNARRQAVSMKSEGSWRRRGLAQWQVPLTGVLTSSGLLVPRVLCQEVFSA